MGTFSIDADTVLPIVATISVDGSDWHSSLLRELGDRPSSDGPALVAGENLVGDLVLETNGAVAGRVVSPDGQPVSGVDIRLTASDPTGNSRSAYSDREGKFKVSCVSPGTDHLDALVKQLPRLTNKEVRVARAETTQLGDVVLPELPQIRGVVDDEKGAPIPGVKLTGAPHTHQGYFVEATTLADGTFAFDLPQTCPYVIDITSAPGFDPWKADKSARMFDPGTKDVRIVLVHAALTTFHVLDAGTRAPIEHFGIRVTRIPHVGEEWMDGEPKPIGIHQYVGGSVTFPATPGLFSVVVTARDHAPFEGAVVHDAGAPGDQTIALARASRLIGRIVVDGVTIESVKLELESEWLGRANQPDASKWFHDVDGYLGRKQQARIGGDGAFAFDELTAGTYQLRIDGEGVARKILHDLRVPRADTLDLGHIDVVRGATVRVRVLTTEPESPVGIGLWMDQDIERLTHVERPDGIFEFVDVEAGPHCLRWSINSGWDAPERDPDIQRFDLVAGETREIVVDARAPPPCTVTLHVTRGGKPVAGVGLSASSKNAQHDRNRGFGIVPSDADGTVTGSVAGGSVCDLRAWSSTNCALAAFDDVAMPAGGHVERTLELHTGKLLVELPADLVIPDNGEIVVHLKGGPDAWIQVHAYTPHCVMLNHSGLAWTSSSFDCGEMPAGDFDATVNVYLLERDAAEPNRLNNVALRPEYKNKVTVEEGHEARIVVP